MKKYISLFISMILIFSLVSACSNQIDTSQPSNTSPNNTTEPNESNDDNKLNSDADILVWINKDAKSHDDQLAWSEKQADYYAEITGGAEVSYEWQSWDNYLDNILAAIVAQTGPDAFHLGSGTYPVVMSTGGCLDLTDDYDMFGGVDSFFPAPIGNATYDGRIYGVPFAGSGRSVWFNRKLFDEAGVEYPVQDPNDDWTWDEFTEKMDALRDALGYEPFMYNIGGVDCAYFWYYKLFSDGAMILDETNTKAAFNSQEGFNATKALIDLFRDGHMTDSTFESDGDARGVFSNGELPILFEAFDSMGEFRLNEALDYGEVVGSALFPIGDKGYGYLVNSQIMAIASFSKYPEEVKALIAYSTNVENQIEYAGFMGWIPNKVEAAEHESFQSEGFNTVAMRGLEVAFPWPQTPELSGVRSINMKYLRGIYEDLLSGNEIADGDIWNMLSEMEKEVNALLDSAQ